MVRENERGITLIALVISIIILLILAGITIVAISGENGIIQRAVEAREETEEAGRDGLRDKWSVFSKIPVEYSDENHYNGFNAGNRGRRRFEKAEGFAGRLRRLSGWKKGLTGWMNCALFCRRA